MLRHLTPFELCFFGMLVLAVAVGLLLRMKP